MHQDSIGNSRHASPSTSGIIFKTKSNPGTFLRLKKKVSEQNKYHLSIETKANGTKLVPKSHYLSKTTKNEGNDDSYNLSPQKAIDIKSSDIPPRTWGSPITKRQLRKITTAQQAHGENFASPISKTNILSGFESPPFSSFYHDLVIPEQPYTALSSSSKNSAQVILNDRYIKSNPHFSKFNRSIYAVDKRDTDKLSLSKESFYYPEQVEAIENIKKYKSKEQEINLSLLTKIIKENKKEEIEIPQGKTFYLKLYTFGKSIPLKVTIEGSSGTFDVYVSRIREKPNLNNHDLHFRNNTFELDFSEYDDVKCIFFGIKASQKIRISILCSYTFRSRIQKSPPPILSSISALDISKEQKLKNGNREPVYEFFNKNISREELKDFEELIAQIKKEKKQKMLALSQGKNWLAQNKEIASEYDKVKEYQFMLFSRDREIRAQQIRENREFIQSEKRQRYFLESIKSRLIKIEQEERERKIREAKKRKIFQSSWVTLMAIFNFAREVLEKKRASIALRILTGFKGYSAQKIQRKIRARFERPLIYKVIGANSESYLESNEPEYRVQVNIFDVFNSLALTSRQSKIQKAENVLLSLIQDLWTPMKARTAIDNYVDKVTKIQSKWKDKISFLGAKLQIFIAAWNQFCTNIIEEESKSKKKKYSHIMSLIREFHVLKHGKEFVRRRMREVMKTVHAAVRFQNLTKNIIKSFATQIDIPDSPTVTVKNVEKTPKNSASKVSPKNSTNKLDKKGAKKKGDRSPKEATLNMIKEESEEQNPLPQNAAIPSQEELKNILHKIMEELKQDHVF